MKKATSSGRIVRITSLVIIVLVILIIAIAAFKEFTEPKSPAPTAEQVTLAKMLVATEIQDTDQSLRSYVTTSAAHIKTLHGTPTLRLIIANATMRASYVIDLDAQRIMFKNQVQFYGENSSDYEIYCIGNDLCKYDKK